MTTRFDRVGDCPGDATVRVEGYSPADGRAHGSLDVTVRVCGDCHPGLREQLIDCGMSPYSRPVSSDRPCGSRTIFEANRYTDGADAVQ